MAKRFKLERPRKGSLTRVIVDFVYTRLPVNSAGTVDLSPLFKLHAYDRLVRNINTLRRDYCWYIRKADDWSGFYEFGTWPEYEIDPLRSARADHRVIIPDPRWRMNPNIIVRLTIYRELPARGVVIGDVARFLVDNRAPGTHVVHVQTLYERYGGSKKVGRFFHELRKHYGFDIQAAGSPYCFRVTREPNRKIGAFASPFDAPRMP